MTLIDCGVAAHDDECLCDVKITSPTPITYSLTDLDDAEMVCRFRRLGVPWDSRQMAALMEGLAVAAEARARVATAATDPNPRRALGLAVLAEFGSIHQAVDYLGVDFADFLRDLSSNRPAKYWAWTDERWLDFEEAIFADEPNISAIARDFKLKRTGVYRLMAAYGIGG